MSDEIKKMMADWFDAADFAEFIGINTMDLIAAFPDEVNDALEDIKEIMGLNNNEVEDNYGEE